MDFVPRFCRDFSFIPALGPAPSHRSVAGASQTTPRNRHLPRVDPVLPPPPKKQVELKDSTNPETRADKPLPRQAYSRQACSLQADGENRVGVNHALAFAMIHLWSNSLTHKLATIPTTAVARL